MLSSVNNVVLNLLISLISVGPPPNYCVLHNNLFRKKQCVVYEVNLDEFTSSHSLSCSGICSWQIELSS